MARPSKSSALDVSRGRHKQRFHGSHTFIEKISNRLAHRHARIPYLRRLPLRALLIIGFLIFVNLVVWAVAGIVLVAKNHGQLMGTSALAYSLGLRHALDADHISAIDLMTRRLIATGQRPVTVGTFFSLGHSTIVIITSVVVAATAAGVQKRFGSFSNIGGIIGTSVSAAFLILLGLLNAYILYKLYTQIQKVVHLQPQEAEVEGFKVQGGGFIFRILEKLFKLIDRPWKMYPVGVLFGLGFDTSSEIALLGISSVEGAAGTSIWLILLFPILFTAGMCLVDTMDGALMMSLYVAPMGMSTDHYTEENLLTAPKTTRGASKASYAVTRNPTQGGAQPHDRDVDITTPLSQSSCKVGPRLEQEPMAVALGASSTTLQVQMPGLPEDQIRTRVKDPLTFLYYSFILTILTVICAIVIGILQLLSLVLNTASPTGKFWDGVAAAGDAYEYIGASICGMFILVGSLSVVFYPRWRRWVDEKREKLAEEEGARETDGLERGVVEDQVIRVVA
ncbi:uncharacterized protein PV06_11314 [Exophiala oligosperma]|uniref:Nickel/cobalt efflux system n=1 Tax=Exophiala oligosperma TaxID=215243 RepID=A0A0D2D2F7_9EURO|nr:uncharacterized protein PV06_11314 [Exophiala oligosperma]KIW36420.1 hypothetical protein PV06_11314 [Exophiala oligosperma]